MRKRARVIPQRPLIKAAMEPVPAPVQPPHSLREEVYAHLREEMSRGVLLPGAFLDVNQLAQRLQVSRTPLREALLHLETQGFVTVLPRKGFRLNALSMDDIRHFFEIIGALEAATVMRFGHGLGPADIARMRELNAAMMDKGWFVRENAAEALGREITLFSRTDRTRARAAAQQYLERFPRGAQADVARARLQAPAESP